MPDYSQGKIYTIRCRNDPALIYVGSTIQPLSKRFGEHKRHSKNTQKYPNHQLYTKIEDWNDWYIELYLVYPCNSVEELRQKEGEIIRAIGTLNRCIAGRTPKESKKGWIDKNKEYYRQYTIEYSKKYNDELTSRQREIDALVLFLKKNIFLYVSLFSITYHNTYY